MSNAPQSAVILRVRQAAGRELPAFPSLVSQTWPPRELVIVGADLDPRLDAVWESQIRRSSVAVRSGNWAAALNHAVACTESPFIAFADCNALAAAGRLEAQSAFLWSRPQFGWVSGWSESESARGAWVRRAFGDGEEDKLLAALLHENPFLFGTVMMSRACFNAAGGFDERLPAGAGHDLWLRAGLRSRLAVLPAVIGRWLTSERSAATSEMDGKLPDRRRLDHVKRFLDVHPRGRRILEEALSRHPEDDVLWDCHAAHRVPVQRAVAERPNVFSTSAGGARPARPDASDLYLRCLRGWAEAAPFNELAEEYRRLGNPLLEYLCQLRSLTIDPRQPPIFNDAHAAWVRGVPEATRFDEARAANPRATCAVSVLIATYNRAHVIRESVESVLSQAFADLELVVVDDGSTDHTAEVVRSFEDPRVRYIRADHRGVPAAFNTGVYHTRGRYLAYLGDDDVFYPDHLFRLVTALETSGAALVYSRPRVVHGHYESGRFVHDFEFGVQGGLYDAQHLRRGVIISPQGVLHRRECLVAVGGFDERLPMFEDWDLWVRISERFSIRHLDGITAEYRKHGGNMSAENRFGTSLLYGLLRNYYATGRGLAALLRAATLLGCPKERDRLFAALRFRGQARRSGTLTAP